MKIEKIESNPIYAKAVETLADMHQRRAGVENQIESYSPGRVVRQTVDAMVANLVYDGTARAPVPVAAVAPEIDLVDLRYELAALDRAIVMQTEINRVLKIRLSMELAESVRTEYRAAVRATIKAAKALAEACEVEQAIFDDVELAGFDWRLPRVCLSRSVFGMNPNRDCGSVAIQPGTKMPANSPTDSAFGQLVRRSFEAGMA